MTDQCSNCRFIKKPPLVLDNTPCACRRYPPVNMVLGGQLRAIYPAVGPRDWCGEHTLMDHVGSTLAKPTDPRAKPIVTLNVDEAGGDV